MATVKSRILGPDGVAIDDVVLERITTTEQATAQLLDETRVTVSNQGGQIVSQGERIGLIEARSPGSGELATLARVISGESATASAIASEASRINGLQSILGDKLDASVISNYYTKTQADGVAQSAASGATTALRASMEAPGGSVGMAQAAANAANALAATKADAGIVNTVQTKVNNHDGQLSALTAQQNLLTAGLASAGGINLLPNPDFGRVTSNVPDGWNPWGPQPVEFYRFNSPWGPGNSLRMRVGSWDDSSNRNFGPTTGNHPRVTPNQPYSFSAIVRGTYNSVVRVRFQFKDSGGAVLHTVQSDFMPLIGVGPSDNPVLQRLQLAGVIAPVGSVICEIAVIWWKSSASTAGVVLDVDKVKFEQSALPTGWSDNEAEINAATAQLLDDTRVTVSNQGGQIVSQGERIGLIEARAPGAGELATLARVISSESAQATINASNASRLSGVEATAGGHTARINNLDIVTAGLDGRVSAKRTVSVDAGGRWVGYTTETNGDVGGTHFVGDYFRLSPADPAAVNGTDIEGGIIRSFVGDQQVVMGPGFGVDDNLALFIGPNVGAGAASMANGALVYSTVHGLHVRGLLKASAMEMGSTRIRTSADRMAPFTVRDMAFKARTSGGSESMTMTLGGFVGPDNGAGYHAKRFAAHKMDVYLSANVSGDYGLETCELEVRYNGTGAWTQIVTQTMECNYRGSFPVLVRYTTLDAWTSVEFRARTTQGRTQALSFQVEVLNYNESGNSAGSSSGTDTGGGSGGGSAPPPGGGGGTPWEPVPPVDIPPL